MMSQCQEKARAIKEVTATYRYGAVRERCRTGEIGTYVTYGLRAYQRVGRKWREVAYVSDVCVDPAVVRRLARSCTQGNLDPCHLFDVVEDFFGT